MTPADAALAAKVRQRLLIGCAKLHDLDDVRGLRVDELKLLLRMLDAREARIKNLEAWLRHIQAGVMPGGHIDQACRGALLPTEGQP